MKQIYVNLGLDEKGKKTTNFGKVWGEMKKSDANARAIITGDGLVVVDIDTKDLESIDQGLRKLLPETPSRTTARGYHWYFKVRDSAQFTNRASYTEHVDVRSDGGLIFSEYWGPAKGISYEGSGDVVKMKGKLRKYLLSLMKEKAATDDDRELWSEAEAGQIHDVTMGYCIREFRRGLTFEEVEDKALGYVEKYLGGTRREKRLMLDRVKWASSNSEGNGSSLKGELIVQEELTEEEKREASGFDEYFKGTIVFDPELGVYAEVRDNAVLMYKKTSFSQAVMGASGWMQPKDVTQRLCTIPNKYVVYQPDREGATVNENGDDAINVYHGVRFGESKGMPKLIDKVLDNLFLTDPEAKEIFINWLAFIVQKRKRSGVAWGFFGASGSGKGLMADVLKSMVGAKNTSYNVGDTDLQSSFNPYAMHKLFVHLNEVASDFHGRHGVAGKLKALVSDTVIRVNQKGISEVPIDNYCNVILNSNKPNPIELDPDDRRWNMVVSKQSLTECSWWYEGAYDDAVAEALDFGAYLMTLDVDTAAATRPMVDSVAKNKVIEQTSSPMQLLGRMLNKGQLEQLLDMLDLDDDDIRIEEIEWCIENDRWPNHLLIDFYRLVMGKPDAEIHEVRRRFITPYLNGKSLVFKDIHNKTSRGLGVTEA